MIGCDRKPASNHPRSETLLAMKLQHALRRLRWVLVAFALGAFGQALAQEVRPVDLEATRAALTTIETALKDKGNNKPPVLEAPAIGEEVP